MANDFVPNDFVPNDFVPMRNNKWYSTLPNRGETAIGGERKFHMFLIRERKFHCLERGNSTLYIYVIII